ncbi:hypothetical protein [Salegentibacter salarius]|uniref:Uncharacterized protein n=1 Tax=Salegentibacter salarius TaxID=435906 RepID=A0A2N0TX29_9FLAO|nr:hypothetical protein [Salegentibacter salarius]OEY72834.1 hypothetical protein BHS39_11365 [Salegentibacter salarius]PKD19294.1 hypothetical protein APR40_11345 [Salegentibacter salarius]SLK00064.1 hypothetical protein SAMN05660445_02321 [Salegentibacter salarius]
MPMSNNGFKWRPNDNSAVTNLRYTLEAEKWVNAVSSAQRKTQPGSVDKDFLFIGMLFQLVLCVLLLVLLGILQLLKALVQFIETSLKSKPASKKVNKNIYKEYEEGPVTKVWNIDNSETKYPSGWQLIFWTNYGTLRGIWKFLFLFTGVFVILVVVLYILSQWIPNHFKVNQGTLIFAAGVSLWNAFIGMDD